MTRLEDVALQSQRGNELLEHAIEGSTYLYRWNAKAPHDAVNTNTLNSYYNCEDSTCLASLTYKVCKSTGGVQKTSGDWGWENIEASVLVVTVEFPNFYVVVIEVKAVQVFCIIILVWHKEVDLT